MAKISLEKMSTAELRDLSAGVDKELQKREKEEVKQTAAKIKELANSLGMSVDEVLQYGKKNKAPKGQAKYRNPSNPLQTWTGKGRKPTWIRELLGQGKDLGELEI
jgi:DNA-binding protein H-NS